MSLPLRLLQLPLIHHAPWMLTTQPLDQYSPTAHLTSVDFKMMVIQVIFVRNNYIVNDLLYLEKERERETGR